MMRIKTLLLIFLDIMIIIGAFLFLAWLEPNTRIHVIPTYAKPFFGFSFMWIMVSIITHKYKAFTHYNFLNGVCRIFRSNIIILAIVSTSIIIFHQFTYSKQIVFGTMLLAQILEIFLMVIATLSKKILKEDIAEKLSYHSVDVTSHKKNVKRAEINYELPEDTKFAESVKLELYSKYLKNNDQVCFFVDEVLATEKIPSKESLILNTHTLFNIENIDKHSQWLFINLHKVNDFRRLNKYFIKVNHNLKEGGYFVGYGETINERFRKIYDRFPVGINHLIYGLDFTIRRIFPKIPIIQKIYFSITKGHNRALSKAEILGRLYYSGFKIIEIREIDYKLYYIAQKVSEPKTDKSPSYGPFIKMRRVGKDAEIIYVYKFRTMHPYSEYLQEYMYDTNSLEEGGKIKNDFRITTWGKVFRKLWIDELPQFINVLRGEIGIVGVRALSFHYFGLYPEYLQKLRTKFKPGLVPPFYVDLPKTFFEILESEEKYLRKREKRPVLTNIEYFFKSWYNILIKKARSQ
jgi:hypothetical protein